MRLFLKPSVVLLAVALVAVLGLTAAGASSVVGPGSGPRATATPKSQRPDGKLSFSLAALVAADDTGRIAGADGQIVIDALTPELHALVSAGEMRLTDAGDVQVYVVVEDNSERTLADIAASGADIERVSEDSLIVQALVPVRVLQQVSDLSGVKKVRLPDYGFINAGSIQTEGDAVMQSDDVRDLLGVDGSGITVGVISDGVGGLAASQASGDLPAVDTTTCNVVGGDPGAAGAEGTAMLEIVHDVAPGAALMFGNFGFGTSLEFNAAVNCVALNSDIVVDDVAWFVPGPYNGTSSVSANTADALNGPGPIKGYFTSVGNYATRHYQEDYQDSGESFSAWTFHEFDGTANTKNTFNDGPHTFNAFAVAPFDLAVIRLTWDDLWGTSSNDYDLFYVDVGVGIVPCGTEIQNGDDDPTEVCVVENTTGESRLYGLVIANYLGTAAPTTFDLFCQRGCLNLGSGNHFGFNTRSSSVPSQSDSGGSPVSVISVGAVPYSSPSEIESFSSQGPTEDGRLKPDIVAPDGGCTTGSGGFKPENPSCQGSGRRFYGTSAAAPHAAAVAALLLDCGGSLSRSALRDSLLSSAVDLGSAGPDQTYGHGLIDAVAAASTAGCEIGGGDQTPTPTHNPEQPTPTPVATSTETPTVPPDDTPTPVPTFAPLPTFAQLPTWTPGPTWTPVPTWTPQPTWTPNIPLTATPTPTFTLTPTPATVAGDTSCDGVVNPLDAALILQLGAGLISVLPCPGGGDPSGDGVTNPLDAALILQFSAGLIATLPP